MTRTRRSVLSAGAALVLPGCTGSESEFDPPDVDWRIETDADRVTFVHDGGDPVDVGDGKLRLQHENGTLLPIHAVRTHLEADGSPPDPLTEGDAVSLTLRGLYDGELENGDTVRLLWTDPEHEDRVTVLAEHELRDQPSEEPPEIDWRVEENATHVRFVHDGGDVLRAREEGESRWAYNHVVLDPEERPVYYPQTPGRVREGDVVAIDKRSVAPSGERGAVHLEWENRRETENATLASYEVEVPESSGN